MIHEYSNHNPSNLAMHVQNRTQSPEVVSVCAVLNIVNALSNCQFYEFCFGLFIVTDLIQIT